MPKKRKNRTLVERAKAVPVKSEAPSVPKQFNQQKLDLTLCWIREEITTVQMAKALKMDGGKSNYTGNVLYRVASWLKEGYKQGLVDIIDLKEEG